MYGTSTTYVGSWAFLVASFLTSFAWPQKDQKARKKQKEEHKSIGIFNTYFSLQDTRTWEKTASTEPLSWEPLSINEEERRLYCK